jgi:hypothetical protein
MTLSQPKKTKPIQSQSKPISSVTLLKWVIMSPPGRDYVFKYLSKKLNRKMLHFAGTTSGAFQSKGSSASG